MNKQELNNAFESFNPTEEQKQRMLANIMTQKSAMSKTSPHIWRKIYIPACGVAAAVIMFAVIYGNMTPKDITNGSYVVQNTDADVSVVSEYTENAEKNDDFPQTATKENIPNVEKSPKANINKPNENISGKVDAVKEAEIVPGEVATFALNINTASPTPRSRAVHEDMASVENVAEIAHDAMPAYGGGDASAEDVAPMFIYDDFCSEIGFDPKDRLVLPSDMIDITDTERTLWGVESPKEWDIVYQGSDSRILTMNVSQDIGQNMQYFEDEDFVKTDVNGTPSVVIFDTVSYTAYVNHEHMAYVISTTISEDELATVLRGIVR